MKKAENIRKFLSCAGVILFIAGFIVLIIKPVALAGALVLFGMLALSVSGVIYNLEEKFKKSGGRDQTPASLPFIRVQSAGSAQTRTQNSSARPESSSAPVRSDEKNPKPSSTKPQPKPVSPKTPPRVITPRYPDFGSIPHPFLSRYSEQFRECAAALLRFLNDQPPRSYRIDGDVVTVELDTGYIRATVIESADKISYSSYCHESTHDGGGHCDDFFALTRAQDQLIPETVLFSQTQNGLKMPPSAGYWFGRSGRCFLVNPFGLHGVFELWIENRSQDCGWGDDPEEIKSVGYPPDLIKHSWHRA